MDYKGYNLQPLGTFPMIEIKAKGQGRVPEALEGLYTTFVEAKRGVDMYLESLKKGKRNVSTEDASTG